MTEPEINISVENNINVPVERSWLQRIAIITLESEGVISVVEIGLVITDSKTIHKLNRTYRGENKPTDVLAFHMTPNTNEKSDTSFVSPPDGVHHLGEVVISYPQAVKQAQEQGHSTVQELALLIVHGILHLLGYDHELPDEEQKMRVRENKIIDKLESV